MKSIRAVEFYVLHPHTATKHEWQYLLMMNVSFKRIMSRGARLYYEQVINWYVDEFTKPDGKERSREMKRYGGFWKRLLAYLIDIGAVYGIQFVTGFILGFIIAVATHSADMTPYNLYFKLIGIIEIWLYFSLFESSHLQATPGKQLLKLVVTDLAGNRIGLGRASGRYWSKLVSALTICIGYIMAGLNDKKRALHDMMAGTLVVNRDWHEFE